MLLQREKAQSTVEYAIIIAVVISALLAMQFWMRRGVMGKLRDSSDQIGDQFNSFEATYKLDKTFTSHRSDATTAQGVTDTSAISVSQVESGTKKDTDKLDSTPLFKP